MNNDLQDLKEKIFSAIFLLIGITIFVALMMFSNACTTLPQLYQTAEDIATDEAVIIEIDRAAIQENKDIDIVLSVKQVQVKK